MRGVSSELWGGSICARHAGVEGKAALEHAGALQRRQHAIHYSRAVHAAGAAAAASGACWRRSRCARMQPRVQCCRPHPHEVDTLRVQHPLVLLAVAGRRRRVGEQRLLLTQEHLRQCKRACTRAHCAGCFNASSSRWERAGVTSACGGGAVLRCARRACAQRASQEQQTLLMRSTPCSFMSRR